MVPLPLNGLVGMIAMKGTCPGRVTASATIVPPLPIMFCQMFP